MTALRGLVVSLSLATTAAAETITIKGSDTLVPLCQRWARAYRLKHPETRLQVTGGGSGTGLSALAQGSTDIAMSSRVVDSVELDRLEKTTGARPSPLVVARDGVTFFVNAQNPLRSITLGELKQVFLGDLSSWKALGGDDRRIIVYTREMTSGTSDFVRAHVLDQEDFAPTSQPLPGTGAVVNAVSRERFGIGFGGAAFARGVTPLALRVGAELIGPTPENVRSGAYPLSRELFFVVARPPSPALQAFLDYVLSDDGQALSVAAGFFPVR